MGSVARPHIHTHIHDIHIRCSVNLAYCGIKIYSFGVVTRWDVNLAYCGRKIRVFCSCDEMGCEFGPRKVRGSVRKL